MGWEAHLTAWYLFRVCVQVARLQSQLAAAQLDVQTAREQAALAAIEGSVSPFSLFPFCHTF
jgi:hypothetical protein